MTELPANSPADSPTPSPAAPAAPPPEGLPPESPVAVAATIEASTTESTTVDVLVIGAGITGLSLAHWLVNGASLAEQDRAAAPQVVVAEAQNRVGGNIITVRRDGFQWEEGPNSFAPTPELLQLAVQVGLKDELIFADRRLPRYVYWDDRLQAVPMSPGALARSRLLSAWGKLRLALGAAGFVRPKLGAALAARGEEETVREFFSRHLGREVTERLVSPFVSGVYAGDIDRLSASGAFGRVVQFEQAGGGLVAGAIRTLLGARRAAKTAPPPIDPSLPQPKRGELGSFKAGLAALPTAIAARLGDHLKLGWRVEAIARDPQGRYQVTIATDAGQHTVQARAVVVATPAAVAARLLKNLAPAASPALESFDYPPVACVVLAYPEAAFKQPLNGFGNLLPRSLGYPTLGTIWASTLFAGRAPAGQALLLNFIGGATNRAVGQMEPAAIAAQVHQDLSQILLARPVEPQVLSVKLWPRAIPQYEVGHAGRLAAIASALAEVPGLFVASNYEGGVALGDCIRHGQATGAQVVEFLGR